MLRPAQHGMPMTVPGWKSVFGAAGSVNQRCPRLKAHAHLLRHTVAVVTLEQLLRARIAQPAAMNEHQRGRWCPESGWARPHVWLQ